MKGDLVGIELGYGSGTQEEARQGTGRHVAEILTPDEVQSFLEAVRYTSYLLPPTPQDAYYILHLAAVPEARGKGVGARLLENAFACARRKGFRVCQLDVASDNPAVSFYQRMGMYILSESRVVPLQERYGIGSHYRMVREL